MLLRVVLINGGNPRLLLLLRVALFRLLLLFILVLFLRIPRVMMVFSEDYGWMLDYL